MATALTQISGYAHVAARYGFEEAVFLDSIIFWYRTNKANNHNFRDGRWWTYNSIKAFEEVFPWWTTKQIRRIANSCREQGALITGAYNEDRRDRSIWYTPSDDLLVLYGLETKTGTCNCPNGQMQATEQANEDAQMGECNQRNTCSNHGETDMTPYSPPAGDAPPAASDPVDKPKRKTRKPRANASVPTHAPEQFEDFWAYYPGGGSRVKAVAAWDKLAPSDELIDVMYAALKRQMNTEQWQDPRYIPHASTWLNQRRWTDKIPGTPQGQAPRRCWADDPEVST